MGFIGPDVTIDDSAYIHETAWLYGKISVAAGASVWPNVVMRAEDNEIVIGEKTNIQDFVMVHIGYQTPTIIGANCSITHHCTLHGCTIGDNCLIGINATIMDGAVIGENTIVAGHAIVPEGMVVPPNSIVAGVPGKVIRQKNNKGANVGNAEFYFRNAAAYKRGDYRAWAKEKETFVKEMAEKVKQS